MNEYFVVVTLIVAFFIGVLTYRLGLKDGLNVKRDKDIEQIKNPFTEAIRTVKESKQTKEEQEQNKELEESMMELFSYDGGVIE